MMFVLLAFVGLAFDVGYLQWQRRRAQSAADGAQLVETDPCTEVMGRSVVPTEND